MITLETLFETCLDNNESPKNFRILYNQLLHRIDIEPAALIGQLHGEKTPKREAGSPELQPRQHFSSILKYYYVFEIFNYDVGISKLLELLPSLRLNFQSDFFKLFLQESKILNKDADFDKNFHKYLKTTLETLNETNDTQEEPFAKDLIIDVSLFINQYQINIPQELSSQLVEISKQKLDSNFLFTGRQEDFYNSGNDTGKNGISNKNISKFLKNKKKIWLNHQIINYKLQDKRDDFINSFMNLINNSSLNYVLTELLSSSFECMNDISELRNQAPTTVQEIDYLNWKFFILNKLPLILSKNLKISTENFEVILEKNLPILNDFNLKLDFLKSLVCEKLIKLERLYHYLGSSANGSANSNTNTNVTVNNSNPPVIEINELLKSQNESIRELNKFQSSNFIQLLINENLVEINPEFTTIDDDNKLYNFLKNFNLKNLELKFEFSSIISNTILKLCDEKDSTRLRRLLFCLSANVETLDVCMFNGDADKILHKLIEVCCNSDYLNESITMRNRSNQDMEDISMFGDDGGDDDMDMDMGADNGSNENYQELYTDFSCILIHIMFISRRYHLQIPTTSNNGSKNVFILNLLENFKPSPANDADILGNSKLKNLQEWYHSIYNDNESLISDELIAKTNLINSFKLIPMIFNQSMISYSEGLITMDLLMNGFEFFMQPVLIINLIPIFYKLNEFLWLDGLLISDLVWQICNKILGIRLEGESKLMFELIWSYLRPDLMNWNELKLNDNMDYVSVMRKLNEGQSTGAAVVPPRHYETKFVHFIHTLINSNSIPDLSIYYEDNVELYKTIDLILKELKKTAPDDSIDDLKEGKNLPFLNYLEISSFALLIMFQFDKKNLPLLKKLLTNETQIQTTNKAIVDLSYLLRKNLNNQFEMYCLTKLVEKICIHLSNL